MICSYIFFQRFLIDEKLFKKCFSLKRRHILQYFNVYCPSKINGSSSLLYLRSMPYCCAEPVETAEYGCIHHSQPGVVLMLAETPTRLYMVTFVNGSPRIPSWIAHERRRTLFAALEERNGLESFNR